MSVNKRSESGSNTATININITFYIENRSFLNTMSSFHDIYPFDLSINLKENHNEMGIFHFSYIFNTEIGSNLKNTSTTSNENDNTNESFTDIQLWLIRGLIWYYAFNHEEAIYCFKQALSLDNNCIMAYYGISISNGPNYNSKSMLRDSFPSAKEAYNNCLKANHLLDNPLIKASLSTIEILLIQALTCRFNDIDTIDPNETEILQNTELYTIALSKIYQQYPDNVNVACMYAESLMNYSPWALWDLNTGNYYYLLRIA